MIRNSTRIFWLIVPLLLWAALPSKGDVVIETRFVEIGPQLAGETGFDWLSGGHPEGTEPPEPPKVRRKARKKTGSVVTSTYLFRNEDAAVVGEDAVPAKRGGISIAGVFTDEQFGVAERALVQKKEVKFISAPTVRTVSGKPARIQLIRPELAPMAMPGEVVKAVDEQKAGVELVVEPVVGADGLTIDLSLMAELFEFRGFVSYAPTDMPVGIPGSTKAVVGEGEAGENQADNRIVLPIFEIRKGRTDVTLWDGQTVVISGIYRRDNVAAEGKVPLLGDVPLLGRMFRNHEEWSEERNLVIFVTAKVRGKVAAAGK